MNSTLLLALTLAGMSSIAVGAATAKQSDTPAQAQDQLILATAGVQNITRQEVISQNPQAFDRKEAEYVRQQRQLRLKYEVSQYALLQQQLDQVLNNLALEKEAKARGVTKDAVLADIRVPAVTDQEVRAYFDANPSRTSVSYEFETVAPQIREYLSSRHDEEATTRFFTALRAKYDIVSRLEPYRIAVPASGPARGKASAPVTIVEFADFQCPYCGQEESQLRAVLAAHPDDVRLVFRHLPISQVHPHAMAAALAAVCADRAGKFWEMHDAMFDDQAALSPDALKDLARRIGLDVERYSGCLGDAATATAVKDDMTAADAIGIDSTPYLFVNGRPIDGTVSREKLELLIADEIRRAGANSQNGNGVERIRAFNGQGAP